LLLSNEQNQNIHKNFAIKSFVDFESLLSKRPLDVWNIGGYTGNMLGCSA